MKNKKLFAILTLVCFMFTLMPMAAFAAPAIDTSAYVAVDGDQTVKANAADPVVFTFAGNDASTNATNGELDFTVWAVDENGAVSSALQLYRDAECTTLADKGTVANTYDVKGANTWTWYAKFARAGVYTVYAGVVNADTTADLANAQLIGGSKANFSTITVTGTATNPEATYSAKVDAANKVGYAVTSNGTVKADAKDLTLGNVTIVPNNVQSDNITVTFFDGAQKLTGATVAIDANSANIEVNKETAKTNILGQIQFKLSASREGNYEIYLSVDGVEYVLKVSAGNTVAAYIATEDAPKAPIALFEGIKGDVSFEVTDINGNIVKDAKAANPQGMDGIFNGVKYLVFTEKPAASTLENSDLSLKWDAADQDYDLVIGSLDAEGTYTVKAILDNGAFATAKFEVKRFGTPVMMYMELADVVELGKVVAPVAKYVDANGVTKTAKDAEITATGYAVSYLTNAGSGSAYIGVKTDEKYAGGNFTVTAVSERYDLVATKVVKVANEATTVKFVDTNLAVNVNNKVEWFIADEEGTKVRLNDADHVSTKYVVLDKPADAKVTVYDAATIDNGEGKMALTSDKVGNVTVQIVVQYKLQTAGAGNTGSTDITAVQTKYYTATQIFAVGTEGVGDVVVMSIGSNEIVINDAKAVIDAAPIVENNRTFVPFRALAEAFGATVAYDEATQAVTAELNGVTVVMTIGSAEYTVNGVAKTADVAPFINGSRTMVPVRFAAEAFGIKVIPTYDENGATADILFNL